MSVISVIGVMLSVARSVTNSQYKCGEECDKCDDEKFDDLHDDAKCVKCVKCVKCDKYRGHSPAVPGLPRPETGCERNTGW